MRLGVLFAVLINLIGPVAGAAAPPTLELVRLLPDPAAPQTDAQDEALEIHNASSQVVSLSGYQVKVGSRTYRLPSQDVAAEATVTLTSAQVAWSLANAGGTLVLLDGSGATVDSATWPKAEPGQWWTKQADGTWAWSGEEPGRGNAASAPLELSELLPDPAAPQTDAADEFVELYNPTDQPVDLAGYKLKTGTAAHTLSGTVPAAGYLALTSAKSHIALANAGTAVTLLDPAGAPVGPGVTYGAAKAGQAWARFEDGWAWTTTATPGAANELTAPAAQTDAVAHTTAKSKAATKAKTSAAHITKSVAAKTTKAKSSASPKPSAQPAGSKPSGTWLLFALAGLTIAYVIYEFRYDLRHFYHQLRGYTGSRTPAG
jgi:hypothetical protein